MSAPTKIVIDLSVGMFVGEATIAIEPRSFVERGDSSEQARANALQVERTMVLLLGQALPWAPLRRWYTRATMPTGA